ncbi:type I restriction enzyme S subunit [Maritalea mobilis]|uniref:Type I restriction enzyme S subunit n=1 Tax=Maritalea mobilis TaxID=483324 RepID=A0A4R6VT54_9HYPH|nr:restriction endonuclease subunit S [Maritalea mobilis]TDQ67263.1 type I restriction enzyme S subunit [Maritalea mobilis]
MSEPLTEYADFLSKTPAHWPKKKMRDVGTVVGGGTPSRDAPSLWDGSIPWVTPGELTSLTTKEISETSEMISQAGLAGSGANLLPPNSLLITSRATLGARAVNTVPMATNQGFKSIVPFNPRNIDFLYHLVEKLKPELIRRASGTTFLEISGSEFGDIDLPLPDVDEATKIAEVLDTLDAAIRGTEAVVAKLKAMKQGLLHDLLTRGIDANGDLRPPHTEAPHLYKETPLGWLPKEWDYSNLGSAIASIDSGWSPACIETPPPAGEWGVLKVSAVTRGVFDDQQSKTLPLGLKPRPALEVLKGDVILTRANGVAELVGKTVQVKQTQEKLMLSDKLLRLVPNKKMTKDFLALLMTFDSTIRQIEKSMSGSSGQKNISQSQIRSFDSFQPPVDEQKEIALRVSAFEKRVVNEERELAKLLLQKSGLMDDLLTGRVPVTTLLDGEAAHGA